MIYGKVKTETMNTKLQFVCFYDVNPYQVEIIVQYEKNQLFSLPGIPSINRYRIVMKYIEVIMYSYQYVRVGIEFKVLFVFEWGLSRYNFSDQPDKM